MVPGGVREREPWGPSAEANGPLVLGLASWDASLLGRLREVSRITGVPLQAVRADRVLSMAHLLMAYTHQGRARSSRRIGAHDRGVEFLRYAAAHKQIKKALEALGVPLQEPGRTPVVLVVLDEVDDDSLQAALRGQGLHCVPVVFPSRRRAIDCEVGRVVCAGGDADAYWRSRFGLGAQVGVEQVQDRLFAQMALVALDA